MADAEQLAVALAEQPRELDAIAEHIDNDDVTSLAMALDPQPSWVRTEAAPSGLVARAEAAALLSRAARFMGPPNLETSILGRV